MTNVVVEVIFGMEFLKKRITEKTRIGLKISKLHNHDSLSDLFSLQ